MGEEESTSPGSEEVVETPVETPVAEETESSQDSVHPGWNEMLEVLPSSLHSIVTPFLIQRDKNYQDGIQKVHSQYESYKPFLENQVPVDRINYALQVAQAIEERPQEMVSALTEYLKSQGMSTADAKEVAQQTVGEPGLVESEIPDELLNHPKFKEMETQLQTVAQYLVSERQKQEAAQQDEMLETELAGLHEKHGDYDEEYVLTWAMAHPDKSLEDGVVAYKSKLTELLANNQRPPAPKVMGTGGGNISNEINSADLKNPQDRKSVVAQMLQRATQS